MRSIKALSLTAAVVGVALISGCAAVRTPVSGCIWLDVTANDGNATTASASKKGTATATSILGWIGQGDCSISAAAKAGGISKVAYVDYHSTNILGFFGTTTTIVYGE